MKTFTMTKNRTGNAKTFQLKYRGYFQYIFYLQKNYS